MGNAGVYPYIWLLGAVALDLVANWALVRSKGFTRPVWGIGALGLISLAFACLARAILVIPLAVAYALWSVLGILGTLLIGRFLLDQHLTPRKYLACLFLVAGVILMNMD